MTQHIWSFLPLVPLGFSVGVFGTLIGAGGGFLLVPVLLLLYPAESPGVITCISLAVVFFNAFSGSLAYAGQGRIDYFTGLLFGLASVPGAVAGVWAVEKLPRKSFDLIFGLLMIILAIYLLKKKPLITSSGKKGKFQLVRSLKTRDGKNFSYSYNPVTGTLISVCVGFVSSILGIGGGIIHVPAMIRLLNFPQQIAVATSHFSLALTSFTGTATHILNGSFQHGIRRTFFLSVGVLAGAQLGAYISHRIDDEWIRKGMSLALVMAGFRILLMK